ncbi:GNAT family N-acetyltransferase [Pelagovum pacificum]|uniref:GNAT family N-acetyltransferase n=1 Tax=Pelagovum pacificum TaxID=2588711 RepID=A0A5C5GJE1_9RHOB|nr:GNAT family N-acetyltransferase [Pelagovum pacificum]QQA42832.1 GNAT family N-acetyltransferase [Pelagovum pacificum]TNY34019.1 GNAT family N-acetyltransferase [Pelagovum pacificum]
MSVTLKPVVRDDVVPLAQLRVGADQDSFVAPNVWSLAQLHYETGAHAFGIMDGDDRVGFCQVIDMREHDHREPHDDENSAFLWRMMIADGKQRQGYGKAAIALICDWARDRGLPRLMTSCVETNAAALAFYQSAGFAPTGDMDGKEVILSRPV